MVADVISVGMLEGVAYVKDVPRDCPILLLEMNAPPLAESRNSQLDSRILLLKDMDENKRPTSISSLACGSVSNVSKAQWKKILLTYKHESGEGKKIEK